MHTIIIKRACQWVGAIALLISSQLYAQTNLALNKTTTASSALAPASAAVDGSATTRWESAHGIDNAWIQVDLGAANNLTSVVIDWEAANPASYLVLGSNDGLSWATLATRNGGTFGNRTDTVPLSGNYRYVRINGILRSSGNLWGYSIWELKVLGSIGPVKTNLAQNAFATSNSVLQSPGNALDGNMSTRWESSQTAATAWLQVDLGATYTLDSTEIFWEAANAAAYEVLGSADNNTWTLLDNRVNGTFGNRTDQLTLRGNYRYLRINATQKSTGNNWGYSIWEWKVYGVKPASSSSKSSIENMDWICDGQLSTKPCSSSASSRPSSIKSSSSKSSIENMDWICDGQISFKPCSSSSSSTRRSSSSADIQLYNCDGVISYSPCSSRASSSTSGLKLMDLSLGKPTMASTALMPSGNTVDGNSTTRWESAWGTDPTWLTIDTAGVSAISNIVIKWEAANAATYDVQYSNDNINWTTVRTFSGGTFGNRTDTFFFGDTPMSLLAFPQTRYVRIYGKARSTGNNWGYSIFDVQITGFHIKDIVPVSSSSALSSSSSSAPADRNHYDAPKAATAPIIDGVADALWDAAPWAPIDVFWLGSQRPTAQDFSGRYKAMWDAGNVYLLFDITDDTLFDATANPTERYWDDDSVEIFLDENKNGGNHQTNTSAWAYHVSTLGDTIDSTNSGTAKTLNNHITVRRVSVGSKHMWEMSMRVYGENYDDAKVNIPLVLFAGKQMGFSACYNDNDASSQRESMVGSVDTQGHKDNQGYINASVFGSMTLVDR